MLGGEGVMWRAAWLLALSASWGACGDASGTRGTQSGEPGAHTGGDAEPQSRDSAAAKVFFFGHSLVGHDMPQMIGAFARARGKGYAVNGQVGFGTPLLSHWRWEGAFDSGFVPVGFSAELPSSLLFDMEGKAALRTGSYDVIVLTESNGFVSGSPGDWSDFCDPDNEFGGCSIEMATNLVRLARMHNGSVRPLLYANWKGFNETGGTVDGWLADIANNRGWWENVADQVEAALAREGVRGPPVRVIPVATILARIVEQARDGELAALGLADHTPLFSDEVHLTSLGFYVVALAHYAAIYRDSPIGLPTAVDVVTGDKASRVTDGFTVDAALASHFQQVVWDVLEGYARSGVRN